jgi:hypothetical protein
MEFHMPHMPHIPHPHLENRREAFLKARQEANDLNSKLAVKITNIVGTMWCAYAFAALALISLPAAIRAGTAPLVAWFAQTFLQLVLLSIIMVGQKVAAAKSDKQLEQTYYDAEALLQINDEMHKLVKQNVQLTEQINNGKRIFFQKHMTHHLLPEIDREWLEAVTNCFLIRDPREVINSYIKKREDPALEDLGFVQQAEIFDFIRTRSNAVPPVVDAKDVLQNPEGTLRLLCEAVGVEFSKSMLSWRSGLRDTDGIWARHWYGEVAKTTSFQPYRRTGYEPPEKFRELYERCRDCYEKLYEHRLS